MKENYNMSDGRIWWAKVKVTKLKTTKSPKESKELIKIYIDGEENDDAFIMACAIDARFISRQTCDFRNPGDVLKKFKCELIEKLKDTGGINL
jgi:hypothetical protein